MRHATTTQMHMQNDFDGGLIDDGGLDGPALEGANPDDTMVGGDTTNDIGGAV